MTTDDLIERLMARAADPARRVDSPQTKFGASVASMSVTDLFGMAGGMAGMLAGVVDANQSGRALSPDIVRQAERLGSEMSTPVESRLTPPVTAAIIDEAERVIGAPFPDAVRRIYLTVADGGFGPGPGLLSIEQVVATYQELVADPPAPHGLAWPVAMVPMVVVDPGYYCLEVPKGRLFDWDPEDLTEQQDAKGWAASFHEIAPDVESWLGEWVESRTPAEIHADEMVQMRRDAMRETRARIAAMTPAERVAAGLPEEGWEDASSTEYD